MLRRMFAAALLSAALGANAQQPPNPKVSVPEGLTYRAAQRLQAGDARGALADVNAAIARDSQYAGAYAMRGTIRMSGGDRAGAIADMSRAIDIAPNDKGVEIVHANRANALWLEGRHGEAAVDVKRALELNPELAPALLVRARLRTDAGDLDGARADLDRAIAIAPKMMLTYGQRAAVHLLAGRLEESLADYKTLMWSLPQDADAVAGHGIVRGLLGETEAALKDLVKARGMNPVSVYDGDRGSSASSPATRLEEYRRMNPNDARALLMRGVIRIMNNDVDDGLKQVDAAVALDPKLRVDADLVHSRVAR
ncbi:MAG TPA: tetratricopeptide repeat protein [Usitatibacter sp.]|nr:tetratricopeptide repeat protein [Usitatibacter sp.]